MEIHYFKHKDSSVSIDNMAVVANDKMAAWEIARTIARDRNPQLCDFNYTKYSIENLLSFRAASNLSEDDLDIEFKKPIGLDACNTTKKRDSLVRS